MTQLIHDPRKKAHGSAVGQLTTTARADRSEPTAEPWAFGASRASQLSLGRVISYAILIVVFISVVYPLVWLVATSLKSDRDVFTRPFAFPAPNELHWDNFARAWTRGQFGEQFANSVILTAATVVLTTLLSAMAAYAISRFTFRGVRPVFFVFLAGLMLPLQQVIVPLFFEMRDLHLLNSRLGLLLVYVALGLPFGIFVMTGFFKTQPTSLYESAIVDGAGELRAFFSVMLPLARPGLITVAIFTFLGTWNEFLIAFMFLSGRGGETLRTLPLGLANLTIVGQYRSDWGMAFAGLVLMLAPVVVVCVTLQRYITKGLTAGAVKG